MSLSSNPQPFVGVLFHTIGGLAAASFYLPYKRINNWSWENAWLLGGVFSWIIAPWVFAWLLIPQAMGAILNTEGKSLFAMFMFGALWGIGGLTYGMALKNLGIALGTAMALGLTTVFGTLIPPIFDGSLWGIIATGPGKLLLVGIGVCLGGIAMSGRAGFLKEREQSNLREKGIEADFHFRKGVGLATLSGVMSSCMAFGFVAGKPLAEETIRSGASAVWQNLPVLIVVLAGGFLTNAIWCLYRISKNNEFGNYIGKSMESKGYFKKNYLLAATAGVMWYLQFFFYGIGTTQMGAYDFSSWTLHMATIIIFGTLWGIALREWRGVKKDAISWVSVGLAALILSVIIVGWSNKLSTLSNGH